MQLLHHVCSATSCLQPPEWLVLGQVDCFSLSQPVGVKYVLHRLHPGYTWSLQWSLLVHSITGIMKWKTFLTGALLKFSNIGVNGPTLQIVWEGVSYHQTSHRTRFVRHAMPQYHVRNWRTAVLELHYAGSWKHGNSKLIYNLLWCWSLHDLWLQRCEVSPIAQHTVCN